MNGVKDYFKSQFCDLAYKKKLSAINNLVFMACSNQVSKKSRRQSKMGSFHSSK